MTELSKVRAGTPTMTAVVAPRYGDSAVLRVERVERPAPTARQVLVRVRAAAVCKGDVHLLAGKPYVLRLGFGLRKPRHRVIGHDFAGEVVAVGAEVTDVRVGESVYGAAISGSFAEYVAVRADRLAPAPAGLRFEESAALPDSGLTALQGLRDVGGLRAGQSVLINGASGGVGSAAVQIAKALGAHVTAVCSTRHIDRVRALGADIVIDYTTEDFTARSDRYDVGFDLAGNHTLAQWRRILADDGTFVSSGAGFGGDWFGPIPGVGKALAINLFAKQNLRALFMSPTRPDLEYLADLVAQGKLRPVIESERPLAEAAGAVAHVAEGHAAGKSVLTV